MAGERKTPGGRKRRTRKKPAAPDSASEVTRSDDSATGSTQAAKPTRRRAKAKPKRPSAARGGSAAEAERSAAAVTDAAEIDVPSESTKSTTTTKRRAPAKRMTRADDQARSASGSPESDPSTGGAEVVRDAEATQDAEATRDAEGTQDARVPEDASEASVLPTTPAESPTLAARAPLAGHELLLEVRIDELPPRLVPEVLRRLASRLFEELMGAGLGPAEMESGATRRRVVVVARGMASHEPDRQEQTVGPPHAEAYDADGAPTPALDAFAARVGVAPEVVEVIDTEKGRYLGLRRTVVGRSLREMLEATLPRVLGDVAFGRGMRWGDGQGPWIRPLRGIVALVDGEVVPFSYAGITSGAETAGHPVLSPDVFTVRDATDYHRQLAARGIVPSLEQREAALAQAIARRLEAAEATLALDARDARADQAAAVRRMALSCEVPGLVEGRFDPALLSLPEEVAIATLRQHPGALLLRGDDGGLTPRFVTVMDRSDDPEGRIRAGFERVVAGRLADARFLRDADRAQPLARRAEALTSLVMHPGLGSWAEQAGRVETLVTALCDELDLPVAVAPATGAARLLKADLATELVRQMPALQGIVGGLYARDEGFVEPQWQAIYDQHLPTGEDDPLPRTDAGRVVAIADRVDRLVGWIGAEGPPSANKDRHGLRATASGLIRLVVDGRLEIDLDLLLGRAARGYGASLARSADEVVVDVRSFVHDRMRHVLGRRGYPRDAVEAALAIRANRLGDLLARVEAITTVRAEPAFGRLVMSAKRIVNIVQDADEHALDRGRFTHVAEHTLATVLDTVRTTVDTAVADARYRDALRAMAGLVEPLDRFFNEVLVMDEDLEIRANRLALLQSTRRLFWRIARLKELDIE